RPVRRFRRRVERGGGSARGGEPPAGSTADGALPEAPPGAAPAGLDPVVPCGLSAAAPLASEPVAARPGRRPGPRSRRPLGLALPGLPPAARRDRVADRKLGRDAAQARGAPRREDRALGAR